MAVRLPEAPVGDGALAPDMSRALQALGNPDRLAVLQTLIGGPRSVADIASDLHTDPPRVRRHLAVLTSSGLVQKHPTPEGEKFRVDQQAAALLNASLVHLLSTSMRAESSKQNGVGDAIDLFEIDVPAPPDSCLVCYNSKFVTSVLDDLDHVLAEARQYHAHLQQLSAQVLSAHEAERKRIARELHDDTAQALTSILVRLRLLERSTPDGAVKHNVEELRELTSGALDSVRRMAVDLRPTALDDLGLVAAVRAYAEKFSQNWPLKVEVTVGGLKRRLPPNVELVLYRVVQEAITNVAKHANASFAWVSLMRRSNVLTLSIRDDGQGFDERRVSPKDGAGLGLFGMRERLALVGGSLIIESAPGTGTTITAQVPLNRRQQNGR